ncbi:MAG TPA: glycosyltransferase [Solirubrobacterales bacterium]|nr:glycosyltransferase [Solirubrobacterales bacterium]
MPRPKFVQIPSNSLERFEPLLGKEYARVLEVAGRARGHYRGRAIWHVNSTLRGGGVAEMLRSLLPYVRGAGIDTRWVVLRESDEFFALTKRIHNNLHGDPGDGGELGRSERRTYEHALATSARHFALLVQPGDVVFLHDPQTAGLIAQVRGAGATVIWRCHIGADEPNEVALAAQDFLHPYVREADAWVFSRREYLWAALDRAREWTMAPSIDPFSPKNQELEEDAVQAILGMIGLGAATPSAPPSFTRADGTPGRVERSAEVLQEEALPVDAFAVAQVSRWDRLKDHRGLIECFARHLGEEEIHLVLAGPAPGAVADDPEATAVWEDVRSAWRSLSDPIRRRVHLASLPMEDLDENGAMVNALQRRADVVVQKSLAEGFGLTVAEAMWKERPVIASRVGGIQDQIDDGASGTLVEPTDLEAVAAAIIALRENRVGADALGRKARETVASRFLGPTRLVEYAERLLALDGDRR